MNGFRGPFRRGGPQGPLLSSGSSVAAGTSHGSGTAVILRESLANNGKTPPTAPQLENLPAEPPFAGALALPPQISSFRSPGGHLPLPPDLILDSFADFPDRVQGPVLTNSIPTARQRRSVPATDSGGESNVMKGASEVFLRDWAHQIR